MDGSNYRNRLVVFRLTEEEYATLKRASAEKGARNLSEFTRTRVLGVAPADFVSAMLQKRFTVIEQQLASVQVSLGRLNHLLDTGAARSRVVSQNFAEEQDVRS